MIFGHPFLKIVRDEVLDEDLAELVHELDDDLSFVYPADAVPFQIHPAQILATNLFHGLQSLLLAHTSVPPFIRVEALLIEQSRLTCIPSRIEYAAASGTSQGPPPRSSSRSTASSTPARAKRSARVAFSRPAGLPGETSKASTVSLQSSVWGLV